LEDGITVSSPALAAKLKTFIYSYQQETETIQKSKLDKDIKNHTQVMQYLNSASEAELEQILIHYTKGIM
jgi:hypothetical protein